MGFQAWAESESECTQYAEIKIKPQRAITTTTCKCPEGWTLASSCGDTYLCKPIPPKPIECKAPKHEWQYRENDCKAGCYPVPW
jgi:hypothetical protein